MKVVTLSVCAVGQAGGTARPVGCVCTCVLGAMASGLQYAISFSGFPALCEGPRKPLGGLTESHFYFLLLESQVWHEKRKREKEKKKAHTSHKGVILLHSYSFIFMLERIQLFPHKNPNPFFKKFLLSVNDLPSPWLPKKDKQVEKGKKCSPVTNPVSC